MLGRGSAVSLAKIVGGQAFTRHWDFPSAMAFQKLKRIIAIGIGMNHFDEVVPIKCCAGPLPPYLTRQEPYYTAPLIPLSESVSSSIGGASNAV